jgi:HlyD family secretion protein
MGTRTLKLAAGVLAIVLVVGGIAYYFLGSGDSDVSYVAAAVSRGPIVRSVSATGTVNPVTTVQVGTYVSGPIIAIYVDFNSRVKAGELMAKIDPRPFAAQVALSSAALANARAQLQKDEANLAYQKVTYERDTELLKQTAISHDQLDNQRSVYEQAVAQVGLDRASIQQQKANLSAAQLNLNYTNIIAPVNGTVVSRNVDVGQTVAASFQTPTLFLVAKDLTRMQVDTNVSESDIGNIKAGQTADFTVDAFPGRVFEGTVGQVRQAPITVQNVVTYDVVVEVANPEFLLKPGMTANVTIITARRNNVLRIPAQALHFSPRKAMGAAVRSFAPAGVPRQRNVWVEQDGGLKPVAIVTGLSDGDYVEVISGDLKPGEMVVTDETRGGASSGFSSPHFPHHMM